MALTPGTRLGPYDILSPLGAGGMGEVYKARDTRLARTVAIKVLPADTAADASARARFEREARAIAALSHPHICVVYDVGREGDVDYLVMELLEGETLLDRLAKAKGPLPLEQVLSIGVAIADALDKAHRAGIVHRDLKPANVMLTKSGPKLLDFGLAKLQGAASPVSLSDGTAATTAGPGTAKGTILGTIHYMAPEQVEGREADTRTDIWALGALLYEMATGQRPFTGESAASIIGAILKDTPPALSTRQPLTPPAFERLVNKCLMKDADERWQSAKDLHDELAWLAAEHARPQRAEPLQPASAPRASRQVALARGVAIVAVVAAIALAVPALRYMRQAPSSPIPETRLELSTPATEQPASFALSPDGRRIVFVASADGASRLWIRPLATTTAQPLAGTEDAIDPFWAPDGRSVGFFSGGFLKRLDLDGGPPKTLAPAMGGRGGTWNADGVIVFAQTQFSPLVRVAASGGEAVAVTRLSAGQDGHRWPVFLPDGHRFLFYVRGSGDPSGIWLGDLAGGTPTRLTPADGAGVFLPSGWLAWLRGTALVTRRIDLDRSALQGDPVTLAESMQPDDGNRSLVSASASGVVAYRSGPGGQRQLIWYDRSGAALRAIGDPDGTLLEPTLSADGQRIALARTRQGNVDIWLLDGARFNRFTFDAGPDQVPVWSPDGTRLVFRSLRSGHAGLWEKQTNGARAEEPIGRQDQTATPLSWSPDGRSLLYQNFDPDPQTGSDLWVLPMAGGRAPWPFLRTRFREVMGTFSPDGRWVAYHSDESGRPEVYVRPFNPPNAEATAVGTDHPGQAGVQWQISTGGGIYPVWRRDGRELYYLAPSGAMMAAPVAVAGATLVPGTPSALFPTRAWGGGMEVRQGRTYDVAPDGRFLINTVLATAAAPITVLMNWSPP